MTQSTATAWATVALTFGFAVFLLASPRDSFVYRPGEAAATPVVASR